MQTLRSVYISTAEWRWVIIISGLIVTLTLLPYAWVVARDDATDEWHFMGMLANPQDGATYLSKIEQGRQGSWLFQLRHTPVDHDGAGFQSFYLFLGHTARITGLSNRVVFHIARVATSLFMYISLYQLGATIWMRKRARRHFFILLAVGSGLGWLWLIISGGEIAADMKIPEAYPFFSAFANPHFPLSIACLALIVTIYLVVFRRGYTAGPSVENGGLGIMLLSMLLALIQPTALVPIGGALVLYVAARFYLTREFPIHELRWSAMLWLPVLPFAVYDLAVFEYNDIMGQFNEQNQTPSPPVHLYIIGYGLLLLVALPGLVRAVRRFERDGDQLMLLWFVVNVLLLYVPFNLQRRMAMGLIIPLVYFATRALEDYWFHRVAERWRTPAMIILLVLIIPTNIINLAVPLYGVISSPESGLDTGLLLQTDYWDAIKWLEENGDTDAVVLAAPNVSIWVPAYTHQVVVYGHEFETVPAEERLEQVEAWYRGQDCTTLLGDSLPFTVRYVLWGPQEADLGRDEDTDELIYPDTGKCIDELPADRIEQEIQFGAVAVFVLSPASD